MQALERLLTARRAPGGGERQRARAAEVHGGEGARVEGDLGGSIRRHHGRAPRLVDGQREAARGEAQRVGHLEHDLAGGLPAAALEGDGDVEDARPQVIGVRPGAHGPRIGDHPAQGLVDAAQVDRDLVHEVELEQVPPQARVGVGRGGDEVDDLDRMPREVGAGVLHPVDDEALRLAVLVVVAHRPQVGRLLRERGAQAQQAIPVARPAVDVAGDAGALLDARGDRAQGIPLHEVHPALRLRSRPRRAAGVDHEVDGRGRGGEAEAAVDRRLRDGERGDRQPQGARRAQLALEQGAGDAAAAMGRGDRDAADRPGREGAAARHRQRGRPAVDRGDRGLGLGRGVVPDGGRATVVEHLARLVELLGLGDGAVEAAADRLREGVSLVGVGADETVAQTSRGEGVGRGGVGGQGAEELVHAAQAIEERPVEHGSPAARRPRRAGPRRRCRCPRRRPPRPRRRA